VPVVPPVQPTDAAGPAAGPGLDDQLCFALYSAARTATGAYREALAPLGLTYTQYVTLLALWEDDGASVSALGRRLHLDSGTLSPLLRRLQTGGLVDRRRDPDDERRVTVHLTDRGWALRPQVVAVQQRLRAAVPMTPQEAATLRDLALRFCSTEPTVS
jgi:DNA-binding MarR family transcriptional regulator